MEKKKMLGTLSKVELQKYWDKEDKDFTPWLSKEENMELLGEAIGMDLELKETEHLVNDCKSVGGFKVDILAERVDTEEESFVVIENQLRETDHKHLGQLLTYASGIKAKAVVWIAKEFDEEHRRALDWLNENSSEDVSFFGLEIELWKIEDSLMAPKFNVVSKPNDWFKNFRKEAQKPKEGDLMRESFWTEFVKYMKKETTSDLNFRNPYPSQCYDFSIGRSGFLIRLTVSSQKNRVGCKLRIVETEKGWATLYKDKQLIEQELNAKLEWQESPEKKSSVIAQYKEGNFQNREEWPQLFAWLKERAEAFHNTFSNRIKELDSLPSIKNLDQGEDAA